MILKKLQKFGAFFMRLPFRSPFKNQFDELLKTCFINHLIIL